MSLSQKNPRFENEWLDGLQKFTFPSKILYLSAILKTSTSSNCPRITWSRRSTVNLVTARKTHRASKIIYHGGPKESKNLSNCSLAASSKNTYFLGCQYTLEHSILYICKISTCSIIGDEQMHCSSSMIEQRIRWPTIYFQALLGKRSLTNFLKRRRSKNLALSLGAHRRNRRASARCRKPRRRRRGRPKDAAQPLCSGR